MNYEKSENFLTLSNLGYLRKNSKVRSKVVQTNGGDVHAVDDDGPTSRLDQPEEREGQRGFAGTGPAHDTYLHVSTRSTRE